MRPARASGARSACLVLLACLLSRASRRSVRVDGSSFSVQRRQTRELAADLELSVSRAREALVPRGFGTALFRRRGPQAEAAHAVGWVERHPKLSRDGFRRTPQEVLLLERRVPRAGRLDPHHTRVALHPANEREWDKEDRLAAAGVLSPATLEKALPNVTSPLPILPAGDGPWAWRSTRYELLDGGLEEAQVTYKRATVRKLRSLGTAVRTRCKGKVAFDLGGEPTLQVEMSATHAEAGVGASLWDAAVALSILQRSWAAAPLPPQARVLELGAGLALPGLDLARQPFVESVMLTDSRPELVELARVNAQHVARAQTSARKPMALVDASVLEWGPGEAGPDLESLRGWYDLVIGSDVCYEPSSVAPIAELVRGLRAPKTLLIGPATRPEVRALAQALGAADGMRVEERRLTLVCSDDEAVGASGDDRAFHSAGVYSLLVVTPA